MPLPKRYKPNEAEPRLFEKWKQDGVYHFEPDTPGAVYSIDTPPPTVSGHLHLGHCYSYSHPDFIARFWRMNGHNVFYPMGYDDNGLPTERLVEKWLGINALQVGRSVFIEKCLQVSEEAEKDYQALWERLGLSIDWRYNYRTIDPQARRASQLSFIELYRQDLAYRREAPAIWCPECQTSIAQAELNDLERQSEFVTLAFDLQDGKTLPIATTRPELLPACVAVFVHPTDGRFKGLVGKKALVPLFGQAVPIMEDPAADPEKGTGAVMCCTFGDITDVAWWREHQLPMVEAIGRDGHMTSNAGIYGGLALADARRKIVVALEEEGKVLNRQMTAQSVRVHERCDTPVEYILTQQWFIRVLDFKEELIQAGEKIHWHPSHMLSRYRAWVENLNWDWCISRQRYYGVTFPLWYCRQCGAVILADESQLPVDPTEQSPAHACACGSTSFRAEEDIMDTWATSSMTPQIVGRWLDNRGEKDKALYPQVFPFSLRPQAHEIIRTWAFYTIVKSRFHFQTLPWKDVLISGWGIAGEGMGKISKSRGGGPMAPMEMIELYSADAVRYWAASTGPGKDAIISEEKIQLGTKLVTKLWNVARFSAPFLEDFSPSETIPGLTPADRWILARLQALVRRATSLYQDYDYAAAKSEIELFFWGDLADNYLEMCKLRLYDEDNPFREGARYALYHALLVTIKLLAPILPYITEEIYLGLFIGEQAESPSIHTSSWPRAISELESEAALSLGNALVDIATAVRRYKSEQNLPLGTSLKRVQLALMDSQLQLEDAEIDLMGITRAEKITITRSLDPALVALKSEGAIKVAIEP